MSITETTRRAGPYVTDGVETVFAFAFKVFSEDDVVVTSAEDGVGTTLVLTTDYTVTLNEDQDSAPGGTVMISPALDGPTITITSDMAATQPTVFTNAGGFFPRVLNNALDRAIILIQQILEKLTRVPLLPLGEAPVGQYPVVLPSGEFGWSSGTGSDPALRADLALEATGARLVAGVTQVVSTIAALGNEAAPAVTGRLVQVLGYYEAGDKGGGLFRWDSASTATPIAGMIVQRTAGGVGRWFREHGGVISDVGCGAVMDDADVYGDALVAMSDYLADYTDIRYVDFSVVPGSRKVIDGATPHKRFTAEDIDGLTFDFTGAVFEIVVDQMTGTSNVAIFDFTDCQYVKTIGTPHFTCDSPFTRAQFISTGIVGGKGTIGLQFTGNCSHSDVSADMDGGLMPINWVRNPRLTVHKRLACRIGAAGSGYAVGNVLTLTNFGSPTGTAHNATTPATFTVATVGGSGEVLSVTTTTRGLVSADGSGTFQHVGLKVADDGFSVTGGAGAGCKLLPYMADYDVEVGDDMSRNCVSRVSGNYCYYIHHANFSFANSIVWVENRGYSYRTCVHYGTDDWSTAYVTDRNHRGDSVATGSSRGLGTKLRVFYKQLPTLDAAGAVDATFNEIAASPGSGTTSCRIAFAHGMPTVVDFDLTVDNDIPTSANYVGSLFKAEKSALDNTDVRPSRGHIGRFSIGGVALGRGRFNSGLGADGLIGMTTTISTNTTYSATGGWTGELLSWTFRDDFTHTGAGDIILDAAGISSLHVGNINSDGAVTLDILATPNATAKSLAPAGPVTLHKGARFRNRRNTSAYIPQIGDILIEADGTIGANLLNGYHTFHMGSGGGVARTLTLASPTRGMKAEFQNGVATAGTMLYLEPGASPFFIDGSTSHTAGKQWQLTGIAARVALECNTTGAWTITAKQGTGQIEP